MTNPLILLLQWIRHNKFEWMHNGKWLQMGADLKGEPVYPGFYSDEELLELYEEVKSKQ